MYSLTQVQTETQNLVLGHLSEMAYRAYSGTSFSPEKRAYDLIRSYSEELSNDLENMPEADRERYKENYIKHLSAWLSAKSNCISTMITGGSNFPVRRAQKANDSEHKRGQEFTEWRERALKAIAKAKEAAKPEAQKQSERFAAIEKDIRRTAAIITGIDNGTERGCSRPLFVGNLTNRIKTLAKNGETELIIKSLELIKEINAGLKKPIITASNGIWKLGEQAEAAREKAYDRANKENTETPFTGGKAIFNYQADRLQIEFDEKPEYEMREKLKRNGFKWAPSAGVWQRQLTNNAVAGARALGLDFQKQ